MNALLAVNWDELFGYVVHDYCCVSLFSAAALLALAFGVKCRACR
jgi:hypothetical protein